MHQEPNKDQSKPPSWSFHPAALPTFRFDLRRPIPLSIQLVVRDRLRGLPDPDAALLRAAVIDGQSIRLLAALTGERERPLRRRLHKLLERVLNPAFATVLERSSTWSDELRAVATRHFLHGEHLTHIAADLNVTRHHARTCRELVLAITATAAANAADATTPTYGRSA